MQWLIKVMLKYLIGNTFVSTILKLKQSTVKGDFVKNISISSTMGPGIKISLNSFDK